MACATFVRRILIPIFVLGLAVAHAQTISKVSGDGQLVIQAVLSSNPVVVLVRDASGNPLPNAKVTWAVTPTGQGGVISGTTTTDANGHATNTFVATVPNPQLSYLVSMVTASYNGQSVQFTEISVGQTNNTPDVQAFANPQPAGANLSGKAGAQGSQGITIQFLITQGGQAPGGVGNVGVTTALNSQSGSTVACAGGTVYSNAAGFATCNLVYGGKIGAGSFTLSAGGLTTFQYTFNVVAGPPNTIVLLTGNNVTGIPGQEFTLTAQVTDIGGNTLSGIPMTWAPVVPGTVSLSTTSSTTDTTGRVSTTATLGNASGPVQVQLSTADGKVTALFNITVNVVVAGLNLVSGSGQSVLVNQPFPNPLIVQVNDAQNHPVNAVPVTFALSSGSAVLSATSVTTGANGQASITATAGATAGPVVILASATAGNNTFSQTFNLTVTPPGPVCDTTLSDNDTFFNGASYAPNFISPGGIALIYCQGIANGIQGVVTSNDFGFGPLPTQVQGVTVQFNPPTGPFSPIYYLANQNDKQWIAVQVPFETPPNTPVTVVVTANAEQNVNPLSITLPAGAPGFLETVMSDGKSRAILIRGDGQLIDLNHKAKPGDTLTAFVTGLIPPTNSSGTSVIQTNEFAPPGSDVVITTPIVMGVGHEGTLQPPTAKYAHDLIGVWEVTFVVPSDASSGDQRLNIGIPDPTKNNKLILNKRGSVIPIN
jgi:uncharacterized protein (TIGR03437 family)